MLHHPPPLRVWGGVERGIVSKLRWSKGGANLVIGGRSHFDEGFPFPLVVQALDHDEHPVFDPRLKERADFEPSGLVGRVQFENRRDGIPNPVIRLVVLAPASFGDAGRTARRSETVTPVRASGHRQGVATPT